MEDQKAPTKPEQKDNSKLDPELRNYYVDIKQSIQQDYSQYIGSHPEIRQLLNDFMSSLLLHKPENVYKFTKDYFAFFNKEGNTKAGPLPLVIMGPSGVGKVSWFAEIF